ncbi:N,N-dimethylformamidase beta subunit family domain-containing protein [Streptacidiphilus cavernicola]|uniref:N,N-dimethylformamidase beta subunit family domain-containing protein n=1 Tax=Streptacidiphilus cavernicola TaxID=3342716 RepID=A0ABV6W3Z6_9ACTN
MGAAPLYYGYKTRGVWGANLKRAYQVSFDRPYMGSGLPTWFELELAYIRWAEQQGYDVGYASSLDLHEGRVDPALHRVLSFSGHDEYWSPPMRAAAEQAVAGGTHLAYLAANNIYFQIRLEPSAAGTANRTVVCYKEAVDPAPDANGPTIRWRQLDKDHSRAEQALLGVQYNGMLAKPVPLVVSSADHWLWAGAGVKDGEQLPDLVAIEADGRDHTMPLPPSASQVLLSASPYPDKMGRGMRTQNTSLYRTEHGTMVFAAGTFYWPLALSEPGRVDQRVQIATRNLYDHLLRNPGRTASPANPAS